jgi:hypothetical protein
MGSYLASWTDEGQRVAVCFRSSVEDAWKEIYVRTGNPASFVGVGQGRSKPAVIADAVGAMEFDGLTTKEFFRPPELQSPNGRLHRVAVSNTDHVWFFGHAKSSGVVYSSADRVKWDTAHGINADVVKAFGDSVLLISQDGITVLKFRQALGKVTRADETRLTISPNPAKDVLIVSALPQSASIVRVSIYDEAGRAVRNFEERVAGGSVRLDVQGIETGSYLLRIETGRDVLTSKFVIHD